MALNQDRRFVAASAWFCLLLALQLQPILATSEAEAAETTQATDQATLTSRIKKLFEAGNLILVKKPEYVDLTLLIGLTGAGKSTMSQIITGDLSKIEAVGKQPNLVIRGIGDKISSLNSPFTSWTTVPELFIDAESNSALYDFPGFNDNRGTETEIANGHFMNEVIRHARSVRLLIVENYSSLQKGEDRGRFFRLVSQTLQFVRNVTAYEGGIALLATKTRVFYEDVTKKEVVDGIAESLIFARHKIEKEPWNWPEQEENIKALFDSWLKQDSNGDYVNIGYFLQPRKVGTLSTLAGAQENLKQIREMVFNNKFFAYKPCNASHFGTPLSQQAVLDVQGIQQDLVGETKDNLNLVQTQLLGIVGELEKSKLNLDYVKAIAEPLDSYIRDGKDLKSAIETVGKLGEIFENAEIQQIAKALEGDRQYIADLEKLPQGSFSTTKERIPTTKTSEVTIEAQRVVDQVAKALGSKLRTAIDIQGPLIGLKSILQERLDSGVSVSKLWDYLMHIAKAYEDCGPDFEQNVKILKDLARKLDVSESRVKNELKKLEEFAAQLNHLDVWDSAEAPKFREGLDSKIKDALDEIAKFAGAKAGVSGMFPKFGQSCSSG